MKSSTLETCFNCAGAGSIEDGEFLVTCTECDGMGVVEMRDRTRETWQPCPGCGSEGLPYWETYFAPAEPPFIKAECVEKGCGFFVSEFAPVFQDDISVSAKWRACRDLIMRKWNEAEPKQPGFDWGPCGRCGKEEGAHYRMCGYDLVSEVFRCRVVCRACKARLVVEVPGIIEVVECGETEKLLQLQALKEWKERASEAEGEKG